MSTDDIARVPTSSSIERQDDLSHPDRIELVGQADWNSENANGFALRSADGVKEF